jgi:hypothetical protein
MANRPNIVLIFSDQHRGDRPETVARIEAAAEKLKGL